MSEVLLYLDYVVSSVARSISVDSAARLSETHPVHGRWFPGRSPVKQIDKEGRGACVNLCF